MGKGQERVKLSSEGIGGLREQPQMNTARRSRNHVAKSCTLLYRRFAIGGRSERAEQRTYHSLRITNPRYGRVQLCATGFARHICGSGQASSRGGRFAAVPVISSTRTFRRNHGGAERMFRCAARTERGALR